MDIDLEKFFDNVPQDRLMSLVNNVIHDGNVESLISLLIGCCRFVTICNL